MTETTRTMAGHDPCGNPPRLAASLLLATGFAACLASVGAAAAQDLDAVEIRTERVAEGLYVLYGAGGNIGLAVGPDAAFVVDDQFAPLTPKILAAIRDVTTSPVRFVLNTHWHFDHVGGNEGMGEAGALLVAHDNVRERMSTPQFMEFMQREVPAAPEAALPVVTFSDGVAFHINGGRVSVMHVPHAHTDGDAVVFFEAADAVHMGDVFVRYGYPFVDLSAGGSVSGIIDAVDRVLERIGPSTKVIPGHGEVADAAALRRFRDVLATIRDRVARQVAAGASLEEVLASKPTAEFDAEWSGGFVAGDDFVRFAYEELAAGGGPSAQGMDAGQAEQRARADRGRLKGPVARREIADDPYASTR